MGRDEAESDIPRPQCRQRDRVRTAPLAYYSGLGLTNNWDRLAEISVEFDRVVSKIQMAVDDQHAGHAPQWLE